MRKIFSRLAIAMIAIATLMACDDTTEGLGVTLTDNLDNLKIAADTFKVSSQSMKAGSVICRNTTGYLGRIQDPETETYITCDFMTQFHTLEQFALPSIDSIASKQDGQIIADSCELRFYFAEFYGDSLALMKATCYELEKPVKENINYLSDFDPLTEGYVRTGEDALRLSLAYTLKDLRIPDSTRNKDNFLESICIPLNDEYTDKDGKTYNNYGTYLLRKYYEDPENFRDQYKFINNICPGFYVKMDNGLGSMAYINISQLFIYFRSTNPTGNVKKVSTLFAGTEEVLQTTHITNDSEAIDDLVADNTCTYLKSPAGIFTQLTLPVDEIMSGHENDTINTAKISLRRLNNSTQSEYALDIPNDLLMIPIDSLDSFFSKRQLADNKKSFVATYSSKSNEYTFNNISELVTTMYKERKKGGPSFTTEHPNWNKVVVIPVSVTTTTSSNNSTVISDISHDMSLTSTRLIGGIANLNTPITISVIYSKFE